MDAVAIWLLILVFLPFLLFFLRILLMAWNSVILSRRIKNLSSELEARQVPTVSGSVDGNSITSSDAPSSSQSASGAHIKVDLPPTYDEVMKTFLETKQATVASSEADADATTVASAHGINDIDIDDPPPPQYSSI